MQRSERHDRTPKNFAENKPHPPIGIPTTLASAWLDEEEADEAPTQTKPNRTG
jgi:hypothetical protein